MDIDNKPPRQLLTRKPSRWRDVWKHREFYIFMLPAFFLTFLFLYVPMYGVLMAFQNVKIGQGFAGGQWIGFDNFTRLFNSGQFLNILKNTLTLNLVNVLFGIPIPIILAVVIHNCTIKPLRRLSQTASYIPYLLSTVVVISILNLLCNGEFGLINIVRSGMGMDKISFFGENGWVLPLFVITSIWQNSGYGAVIYLASMSAIDPTLIEAATIDGATKMQRIRHIDLQIIKPTIVTMLLLNIGMLMGSQMSASVEKILLMQTPLNLTASETILTYVYKAGIVSTQYGFSTAVNLFNNVCNLILLVLANALSRKIAKTSLY